MPDLPEPVSNFLKIKQELEVIHTRSKELKKYLSTIEPAVTDWLREQPQTEFNIPENLGQCGKLKFTMEKKREYLSKSALYNNLFSFFTNVHCDKSTEELKKYTRDAVEAVWGSMVTGTVRKLVRTFPSKKRKLQV